MNFLHSLQSEILKTKRSAAAWLALAGGFFIPGIYFGGFVYKKNSLNNYDTAVNVWEIYFHQLWQNMSAFLLPMGVVLAGSLITQLEYKNNAWKQLHATPQKFSTIYFAKFSVILLVIISFFILFNIGIILTGIIPCLLFDKGFPRDNIPVLFFLKNNLNFFITCLPIIAIQYLLSLKFKNFLIPVGIGFLGIIGTLIALKWEYIYISPFSYSILTAIPVKHQFSIYGYSGVYFILLTTGSYLLYISKKEKG